MLRDILKLSGLKYKLPEVLVLTVIFYFYKNTFWPITFVFILSTLLLAVIFLINFDRKFRFLNFLSEFYLPLILASVIIIEVLLHKNYTSALISKEIVLFLILFFFFYLLYWTYKSYDRLISFAFIEKSIVFISVFLCIINIFFKIVPPIFSSGLLLRLNISDGQAIAYDYNFFGLFILFGFIVINFRTGKYKSGFSPVVIILLNFLFSVNIILLGSRRSIFAFILLVLFFLLNYLFVKRETLRFYDLKRKNILLFLVFAAILPVAVLLFKKIPEQHLLNVINRYRNFTTDEGSRLVEKWIWKDNDEFTNAGNCVISKSSFEVKPACWNVSNSIATNLGKVDTPFGKGIKIERFDGDRGGFALHWCGPDIVYYSNHTYRISFKVKFIKGNFESFEVGWWVDDGGKDFANSAFLKKEINEIDKEWFSCTSQYTFIENHISPIGFINSVIDSSCFIITDFEVTDLDYDPNLPKYAFDIRSDENSLVWVNKVNQPWLSTNLVNNGSFKHDLSFWKCSMKAAIEMKYCYIDGRNCAAISRGDGDGGAWSLYYDGRDIEYKSGNEYQIEFKIKQVTTGEIPFLVGFWVDEGGGYMIDLKLDIDTLPNGWLNIKASYIFKNNHRNLLFPINSQIDSSRFYITDISLKNLSQTQSQFYRSFINDEMTSGRFSDRTSRWLFAQELWKTEYKFKDKLLGHGFDYLKLYGQKFNYNLPDWPHNPFISILLYSGIVGLALYIWLLVTVVRLYYKYRKEYGIAFMGFLITFFFSFFSGNSPFDPPIMGFFILLPFLINSLYRKEKEVNSAVGRKIP